MNYEMPRRNVLALGGAGALAFAMSSLMPPARAVADALPATATHPWIYLDDSVKESLLSKTTNSDWAKNSYQAIKAVIDPLANRHVTDPQWILSRMSMYWRDGERYTQIYVSKQNFDHGTGNAPVPTVRFDPTRAWNLNHNAPIEDRLPYSEDGSMRNDQGQVIPYGQTGHMVRLNNQDLLSYAQQAAFLHWMTGDEKYAAFASDIYWQWLMGVYYMQPPLDPTKSLGGPGGYAPGGIGGYYDYEVIHDLMGGMAAVVYDFLYDYLASHPHPQAVAIGKNLKDLSLEVFKRFIDIGLVRGGRDGNWNINGWACIMPAILALDPNSAFPDGKGREYYLGQYTTTSTQYHEALPDILTGYDSVTGLWHESPGYSFGTINSLLDFSYPILRQGTDTIGGNDVMRRASLAIIPWLDARGNMVVFGDGRGGAPSYTAFERLLTYYKSKADTARAAQTSQVIANAVQAGQYNRNALGLVDLISAVDLVPSGFDASPVRTAYSPHHEHITLKNNNDVQSGLMATLYGGHDHTDHLNPNGLAVQFYGQGWALSANTKSYESYWSADYAYSSGPAGANTIVPGYRQGPIVVNGMEPAPAPDSFTNSTEISANAQFADVSAAEKRRQVAIIRTSPTTGYYVDIFRSDQADNDFVHHNLGDRLTLTDADGTPLALAPAADLGATDPAYSYFANPVSAKYSGLLRGVWTVDASGSAPQLDMRMWMVGQAGRTVYRVDAPGTTVVDGVTPHGVNKEPQTTPTLIVRQTGNNAVSAPFASVFEPAAGGSSTVSEVRALPSRNSAFCGLRVGSTGPGELDGRVEYVLSSIDQTPCQPQGDIDFTGSFAVTSTNNEGFKYLYLGYGTDLRHGAYRVSAAGTQSISAGLAQAGDVLRYSAEAPVRITLPIHGPAANASIAYEASGGYVTVKSTVQNGTVTGTVPAGYGIGVKVVTPGS